MINWCSWAIWEVVDIVGGEVCIRLEKDGRMINDLRIFFSTRVEKLSKRVMWFCARCVLFLLFFWLRILNLLSLLYIRVYILFIVGVKSDSWIYIFWLIDHFTPFRITICLYEHMNKLYNESLGFVINVWARTTNKLTVQLTFLNIKYITYVYFFSKHQSISYYTKH